MVDTISHSIIQAGQSDRTDTSQMTLRANKSETFYCLKLCAGELVTGEMLELQTTQSA